MEARLISDRQRWNDFVAMSPSCTITQSYEWGELASSTGAQALRVGVVNDEGSLCAAMLVFITQVPLLHRTCLYAALQRRRPGRALAGRV
jgi:peptidoglycan pentaglycine glycine transferase (the first glycine)